LVLVTQPYVPAYRHALFDAVHKALADLDIDFRVAAGTPHGAQAARRDEVPARWKTAIRERSFPVGKWRIALRSVPDLPKPAVVVSELEALNLFAWLQVNRSSKLILWGHGKPYVNDANRLSERLEWSLAGHADAIMTYTESGRSYLVDQGKLDPETVTAIGNATDSVGLREAVTSMSPAARAAAMEEYGGGHNALFVGGIDQSKRIDFLLSAAQSAKSLDPEFQLIIVGRGELENEVQRAIGEGHPIRHIPEARGAELAKIASVANAIWMPGRIGLVAVDALALGLPIHTTPYRYHAPEVDFLPEVFLVELEDDPDVFAAESLSRMREGRPPAPESFPTISSVSSNFVNTVIRVMDRTHE
jgi:glycosyltransferase involved in cell wall biosynthesis